MKELSEIQKTDIQYIERKLQDDESKEIYSKKIEHILSEDTDGFCQWFMDLKKEFCCPELDDFERTNLFPKEYILFGAGYEGKITKKILEYSGRKAVAWCDNNMTIWNSQIEEIPVAAPTELLADYMDYAIIITCLNAAIDVYRQLLRMGVQRKRIFISQNRRLLAFYGNQYFDMIDAAKGNKEIFLDGGSYNIDTTLKFIDWCKNDYNKIYIFEPDVYCFNECIRKIKEKSIRNTKLYNYGLWNKAGELSFLSNGIGSSKIDNNGKQKINLISIDESLQGDEVTFIKLDIEGSELEALKGAKETIRKYRPKIAVCIYHKMEDLWEIPKYILELIPDYKLYIRHYTTYLYETVLYAL